MEKIENKYRPAYPSTVAGCTDGGMYTVGERDFQLVGLSKREMFAAMAMQGLLSNPHYIAKLEQNMKDHVITDMNLMCVRESLDMADELLKQLEL